MKKRTVI